MWVWQIFMSLHLKLLDIDHPLTFEDSKLRQIEAHALIYLSGLLLMNDLGVAKTGVIPAVC